MRIEDGRTARAGSAICAAVHEAGGRAHYVGGSVRDMLLDQPVADLDIEVFGLEPDRLEALLQRSTEKGVSLVGASFGVFKVHGAFVDVSVPRRERKQGTGHRGFIIEADPHLDPAVAASRRDYTVNAIAWDPLTGDFIDPLGGREDLERRVLRHTGSQFAEDPLRVLRGMHFVARFGLTPDPATIAICRTIEPEGLAPERIFDEWRKLILQGNDITAGLAFLRDTGWVTYHPELEALIGVEQDPEWHPEGDVWVHTGHVMDEFAKRRIGDDWEDLVVGFACLCHDFGKPSTTELTDGRWRSPGHEESGIAPTRAFLAAMTEQSQLADEVVPLVADHLKPDQLFLADASSRAVRRLAIRVGRLDRLLRVATADRRGRPPLEWDGFPAAEWLQAEAAQLEVLDKRPTPLVMGRHLLDLGYAPGPGFKKVLDACFDAQIDGDFSELDEGLALARTLAEAELTPQPPEDDPASA